MKIPPYWIKASHSDKSPDGRTNRVVACGWSFTSLEDARQKAVARARHIFDIIIQGKKPDSYDYSDRPIREEIVEVIAEGDSQIGVITRNRYGSLVLNSAHVLFADVDFPTYTPKGFFEWLSVTFMPVKREQKQQALTMETAHQVAQWAQCNPSRSFRMYRTPMGLRLLFTDKLYEPTSDDTLSILRGLQSDPMYIKLTQKQECFRARLTAKPWRCDCSRPPNSYPWDNPKAEQAFRDWEKHYTELAAEYRACKLIKEFGIAAHIPTLQTIIAAHDKGARIAAEAPLA